jgi:hypothetical protein
MGCRNVGILEKWALASSLRNSPSGLQSLPAENWLHKEPDKKPQFHHSSIPKLTANLRLNNISYKFIKLLIYRQGFM